MLKQYIVQHLRKFTSGPLAAKDGHSPTNPVVERWNERDFPRILDLPACRFDRAYWPLKADGLAWLRVALGFCSPECCLHASDSKSVPPAALLYSALWEAAACVSLIWHGITGSLELSLACHMSLDGVWLQRLFRHMALPFVRSCTVWLGVKVFTNVGLACFYFHPVSYPVWPVWNFFFQICLEMGSLSEYMWALEHIQRGLRYISVFVNMLSANTC